MNTTNKASYFWDGDIMIQRDSSGNYTACKNYNPASKTILQMPDAADAANLAHDYNREPLACKVQSFSDAVRFKRSAEVEAAMERLIVAADAILHDQGAADIVREAVQSAITALQTDIATRGEYKREQVFDPYGDLFIRQRIHHYARAERFSNEIAKMENLAR
jgi:hypothetical protein